MSSSSPNQSEGNEELSAPKEINSQGESEVQGSTAQTEILAQSMVSSHETKKSAYVPNPEGPLIADGQSLESFKDIGEQNKHELDDQVPEEAKAMSENAHAGGADTMSSKKRNHAEAAMEDAIPEKRQRTDATSSTSLSGVGSRSSDMTSHPPSQAGPFGDSSARAEYGPRRNQLSRSRDIVGNVNALALRRNRLPAYDSDSEEVDVEALLDLFQVRRHADQVRDNRARRQREAEAAMAATAATAATTTPSGQDATRENLATDLFVEQDPQDDTTP